MENQNPKLTARQAQIQIIETIKRFRELAAQHMQKGHFINFKAEIKNVAFLHILKLWNVTQDADIRLYLPGDLDNDNITIVYKPAPGCLIYIESETCYRLNKEKLFKRKINLN